MDSSAQERTKLKTKLQKLFQKHENFKNVASSICDNNKQHKETMNNNANNLTNKQRQTYQKKSKLMENGLAKTKGKLYSENKYKTPKELQADFANTPTIQKKTYAARDEQHNNVKISGTKKQSKALKQIIDDKIQKQSPKNEIKSHENKKIKNYQLKKGTKLKQGFEQRNSLGKNNISQNKDLSEKALNCVLVSNKKQKLNNKGFKENVKKDNKTKKHFSDESDFCSSLSGNEYDVNQMTSDFDSEDDSKNCSSEHNNWMHEKYSESDSEEDNMDHYYKIQNESVESDDSSNNTPKPNTAIRKLKETDKSDLKQFHNNKQLDSDDENIDSDNEYSDGGSLEDDDENYSDYYEDDYEEEDDIYNYGSDSADVYSYYDGCGTDTDSDYELPKHVPEDLFIHNGTANKRELLPEDNVFFNSDNEESGIVELVNQQTLKTIYQPKAYDKQELLKLKYENKTLHSIKLHKIETITKYDDDCPKLVPIVDDDTYQLYNLNDKIFDDVAIADEQEYEEETEEELWDEIMDDCSLGNEYTEINSDDASSLLSEDINQKYLKRYHDLSDSDENIDENIWIKKHKPDVIDATGYEYTMQSVISDHTEASLNDDINHLPSVNLYKYVDLKTDSNVLSTTIIDNKIHFSNENYDQNLSSKSIEAQEFEDIPNQQEDEFINEENSIEESPKATKPYTQSIVNYRTKFFNAFNSNLVLVLLKDPFYIYGTIRLTLLAGSMEIYGHTLKLNTEVEIFSPRGCSMIGISSLTTKTNISSDNLKDILKSYKHHFSLSNLKTIAKLYNAETDAVVLLKRNEARKKMVQQFKKFMNENVFPNIKNINVGRPLYNSEYLLRCMINTSCQEMKCLRLPTDWQQFSLTSNSRVMLAGGKSVGKSTLLRYLINRHLPQKILLIDLDIGQPEIFVPQTVSCTLIEKPLLGPGFMLNLDPEISFVVGHTNIALCAHEYLSAVRHLFAYCKQQEAFRDIPWLINTMGYNKGFGLELISILAQEPLTDIIQLQSSKEINNFECSLHAQVLSSVPHILFSEEYERNKEEIKENWNYRLHIWPSAIEQESRFKKEWEMSAKDLRYAMLLAHLSMALPEHCDWLTDVKPIKASLNDLKIINLMNNTPLVSEDELKKAIEGSLVYLCHYEEDCKPLKCFGLGVVRAIDYHVLQLYLIPSLPNKEKLINVNCLAIGEMPLPTSLFTNQGSRVKNIAPFVYNTIADNASKGIKQIYHRPDKFLSGKHKPSD